MLDFDPDYYHPLYVVEFYNNREWFTALIDTGAQLNIVNERFLPYLEYRDEDCPLFRVRGLGGLTQQIKKWIMVPIYPGTPPKGDEWVKVWTTPMAVLEHTPCPILLGLPFLCGVNGRIDLPREKLFTKVGTFNMKELPVAPGNCGRAFPIGGEVQVVECQQSESPEKDEDEDDYEDGDEGVGKDEDVIEPREQQPAKIEGAPLLKAPHLTEEQRTAAEELLQRYAHLWAPDRKLGCTIGEHTIELTHNRPLVQRHRRFSEQEQLIIDREVQKMIDQGIIRPSKSSYSSQPVLVVKKTGDIRFCIDFRTVNKWTRLDAQNLPLILDLIFLTHGSRWFVALDLRAGYWQIPMAEDSKQYTAFSCTKGLYEFEVMPFGLTNAPATFQRTMEQVFGDLHFKGVLVYLDDILVHAPTFRQTLNLLEEVFKRLERHNFTINFTKSHFFPETLKYLGHILSDGQVKPDLTRVETLSKIAPPKTVHDVRALLGFLGYYHIYIPRFAQLLEPTFALLRGLKQNTTRSNKLTTVQWTPACQDGVDKAIAALKESTLYLPIEGDQFLIETDASDTSVAAALSVVKAEKSQPVMFVSKNLDQTQRNWPVREREAFAIIYAFQKFDTFVRGRKVTVHTDHQSLQWLQDAKKGKLARWAALLAEYNFEVFYKKGSELQHIDYLTRNLIETPDPVEDRMCLVVMASSIAGEYGDDGEFPTIKEVETAQQALKVQTTSPGYHKVGNLVYYRGKIFVPPTLTAKVIRAAHELPPFTHPGVKRTLSVVQRAFDWPKARADVRRFLASCLRCNRAKIGLEELQGLRKHHPVAGPMEVVYMDFYTVTYDNEVYELLNLIDSFTKWAECIVVTDKSAETIATLLQSHWIPRFGAPRILISDREKGFTSTLLSTMCEKYGIKRLTSAPYHPQGNALIEAFHRTLNLGLRYINQRQLTFHEALSWILYGYRVIPHSATQQSPGYLLYGVDLRPPTTDDWRFPQSGPEQERLRLLRTIREEVRLKTHYLLEQRTDRANEYRRPDKFELGQLVCCHQQPLQQVRYKPAAYKAKPKWTIPYRVIKVLRDGSSAVLLCVLTHTRREAHITDVRHVLPPVDETQRQDWSDVIQEETWPSCFEPEELKKRINKYFLPLEQLLIEAQEIPAPTRITQHMIRSPRIRSFHRRRSEPATRAVKRKHGTQGSDTATRISRELREKLDVLRFIPQGLTRIVDETRDREVTSEVEARELSPVTSISSDISSDANMELEATERNSEDNMLLEDEPPAHQTPLAQSVEGNEVLLGKPQFSRRPTGLQFSDLPAGIRRRTMLIAAPTPRRVKYIPSKGHIGRPHGRYSRQ